MFHQRPDSNVFIGKAGSSLARLNAFEGFSRSLLVGVIPLLAYEILGSKEAVTNAYLAASVMSLMITLNFTSLEKWLQRRWVVTLSGGLLMIACLLLYYFSGIGLAAGIGLRSASTSLFSVCLSLYIMDYIGKQEFAWVESRLMVYKGLVWLCGPTLGIWLWQHVDDSAPFLLSTISASLMIAYFWHLRLGTNKVLTRARSKSINPLKIIPRYVEQSALRISYIITLSRSVFWVSLFVYGPIYAIEAGLPAWVAGGLLSFVSALLLFSPLIRKLSEIIGTRSVIIIGQLLSGLCTCGLFVLGEPTSSGLLLWVFAAVGAAILDVLGNIPFMRMVKARERTEMTMIFSTWREGSELLTPLAAAAVLIILPFEYFYLVVGGFLLLAGICSTWLPRRL